MEQRQKIVLILGALIILGMALFPPWVYVYETPESSSGGVFVVSHGAEHIERPAGYHLIFGQHIAQDVSQLNTLFARDVELQFISTRIDEGRLKVQIVPTLLLVGLLYAVFRTAPRQKSDSDSR
jgi:hypothetical protein